MIETVMILGAVQGELSLVQAFQKKGYRVAVVGLGSHFPCCEIADVFYDADIMDRSALLRIAREENVCAVSSNVIGRAVVNLAWLAEELGLPGIGLGVARRFDNKYLMRKKAQEVGIPVPPFALVQTVNEALEFAEKVGFPLVMKPVDGGSSQGVHKVESIEDVTWFFPESYRGTQKDDGVIIEGFIEGEEYIVDAFTHDGVCENTDIAFKEHFSLDGRFVSKSVVIQDADHCGSRVEQMLLETNKRVVEAFGLPFGPTHGEFIYHPGEDAVYLVEIAARGGGVRLASDLIPLATGVSVNELLACYALGENPLKNRGINLKEGAAGWFAFSLPPGRVETIEGVRECLALSGVHSFDDDSLKVGLEVSELVDDGGKFGPFVVSGCTREKCHEVMNTVRSLFRVSVETGVGKRGAIW